MTKRKMGNRAASVALVLALAACSNTESHEEMNNTAAEPAEDAHAGMNHSGSGELPGGLAAAEQPAFEVGSKVRVETDHLADMKGAEATVSGAYDTVVYSISYTPENGERVTGHKWVVHEELENPAEKPLEPETEVTVKADHMDGMAGAAATIDTAEETTVYTISYTTSSGETVTDHMWVTEEELTAAQ